MCLERSQQNFLIRIWAFDFYWSAVINYYNKNFPANFGWKEPEKILAGELNSSTDNSFIKVNDN
jgi:hypothetical protein